MFISIIFCIFVRELRIRLQKIQINKKGNIKMEKATKSFGRTELAQEYFPRLCPEAAWHKLRSWLKFNPRLSHLYALTRRTFTPAEVQLIYAELGEP